MLAVAVLRHRRHAGGAPACCFAGWPGRDPERCDRRVGKFLWSKLQRRNTFSSQVVNVWSGRRDSNPRPSPWQGDALPTEPLPQPNRNSTKLVLACQPRATAISVQLFYALTLLRLSLGDAINSVEGKRSTILGLGNWDAEHGAAGPGWSSSAWYGLEWTVRDAAGGWKG